MLNILCVDDDPLSLAFLENALTRRLNVKVHVAESAKTALEVYSIYKPSLVITDIIMPEMTGIELAYALLKQTPSLRLIFISSSHANTDNFRNASFFSKPLDFKKLTDKVLEIIGDSYAKRT